MEFCFHFERVSGGTNTPSAHVGGGSDRFDVVGYKESQRAFWRQTAPNKKGAVIGIVLRNKSKSRTRTCAGE
jgi:hypothetical protein